MPSLEKPCSCRLWAEWEMRQKVVVRSGIRTHAHRSGLRPERSALDHSAILTRRARRQIFCLHFLHFRIFCFAQKKPAKKLQKMYPIIPIFYVVKCFKAQKIYFIIYCENFQVQRMSQLFLLLIKTCKHELPRMFFKQVDENWSP